MAKYQCSVCGYIFEETAEKKFSDLTECPICGQPVSKFVPLDAPAEPEPAQEARENPLAYPAEYLRRLAPIPSL